MGILWNINIPANKFATGCAYACHTGESMHTATAGTELADLWHWKAGRGGSSWGLVDDTYIDDTKRQNDSGQSAFFDNENADATAPAFMGANDPGRNVDYLYDVDPAARAAVPYDPGETWTAGETLPGIVNRVPYLSRGDVNARGAWGGGVWTLELKRQLDTSYGPTTLGASAQDVEFSSGSGYYFSLAVTDDSGGTHNGNPLCYVTLGGGSAPPGYETVTGLDIATVTGGAAPTIDGNGSDAIWNQAVTALVPTTSVSGTDNGIASVSVQCVYDTKFVYWRFVWSDATHSVDRKQWTWDGTAWSQGSGNEDRLYMMFPVNQATNDLFLDDAAVPATGPFFGATPQGCLAACHTTESVMRFGEFVTGRADVWHWKAVRTNPIGYADDKYFAGAAPTVNGRKSDSGRSAYVDNVDCRRGGPASMAVLGPTVSPTFLLDLPTTGEPAIAYAPTKARFTGAPAAAGSGSGAAGPVSFAGDIQPALTGTCGGCHPSVSPTWDPTSYAAVFAEVNTADPVNSKLLQKPTLGVPHAGGVQMTISQKIYSDILSWVTAGAPNN